MLIDFRMMIIEIHCFFSMHCHSRRLVKGVVRIHGHCAFRVSR